MDTREQQEEKNKRVGWLVSVSIQLFLLVLFYFLVAWKAPFPPIPEYGIELGLTSSAGSTPQPTPESSDQPVQESSKTVEDESQENTPIESPVENAQEDIETETPILEESETPTETDEVAGDPSETTEETTKEMAISDEIETDTTEIVQNPQEEAEEEEVVEEPTVDDRAIYGNQGSETGNSEGASLALAGWIWDFKPDPDDQSDEIGKIVYKIAVDQDGYLVKIETVTSTVSPSVERKYREAVEKLTFSKTSDYTPAALSNGTVTFIIKAR